MENPKKSILHVKEPRKFVNCCREPKDSIVCMKGPRKSIVCACMWGPRKREILPVFPLVGMRTYNSACISNSHTGTLAGKQAGMIGCLSVAPGMPIEYRSRCNLPHTVDYGYYYMCWPVHDHVNVCQCLLDSFSLEHTMTPVCASECECEYNTTRPGMEDR